MSTKALGEHLTRRSWLGSFATGIGGVAVAELLAREALAASASNVTRFPAKAKQVIHIFFQGGLSQVDSFDYKPLLERHHGKALPDGYNPDVFGKKIGLLHRPIWPFRRRGASGLWASDLFPHLAKHVDEFAFLRSMVAPSGNHTPATYISNSGFNEIGYPSMGAWLAYGLGVLSEDLPSFVVFGDARGLPAGGANLWGSGFLPAEHQGVLLRSQGEPIANLSSKRNISESTRQARYRFLQQLNRRHAETRGSI
ncbi:MAG: DUF1501 domain-containing protein, partial [Planctomycetota bacterium]